MKKSVDYYTAEEVAKTLRLHPYTIRRLCREGKIPAFKFGWQWRFRKLAIEAWAKRQEKMKQSKLVASKLSSIIQKI